MVKEKKRIFKRWGDRLDARLVRDIFAYQKMIPYMYPHRCDNEAFFTEDIELANLNSFLLAKNKGHGVENKLTAFDCLIFAFVKLLTQKSQMNRFVQNKKLYDRDELSIAFTSKRESVSKIFNELVSIKFEKDTTLENVHNAILEEIQNQENNEPKKLVSLSEKILSKLPRFILGFLTRIMMFLDLKGLLPKSLKNSDLNYPSVYFSNLGETKLNSGYHHLTNRGTTSIYVIVGQRRLKPFYDSDGENELREILPLCVTIDERIVDETYLSESISLLKFILQNPEALENQACDDVQIRE